MEFFFFFVPVFFSYRKKEISVCIYENGCGHGKSLLDYLRRERERERESIQITVSVVSTTGPHETALSISFRAIARSLAL